MGLSGVPRCDLARKSAARRSSRPAPGAPQTRELEKRRKKRRRKVAGGESNISALILLVLGISICAIRCSSDAQRSRPDVGWTNAPARPEPDPFGAGGELGAAGLTNEGPDYAPAEGDSSESGAGDDYSDFGTYVIAASADSASSGDQPSPSQVLFYAARKPARPTVRDGAPNSTSSGAARAPGGREEPSTGAGACADNYELAASSLPQAESATTGPPSRPRHRRGPADVAQANESESPESRLDRELSEADAKWLSKINERPLSPDLDYELDSSPRPPGADEGGGGTNASSSQPGRGHNVYYWRLVWLVLPVGATFGNLLVIMAVYLERSLQSVTNYFIVSLAFADLFVGLIVMPFAVYVLVNGVWELGDTTCDIYVAVDVTCSTASILNLVAISIDRYRAVAHPLAYSARLSSWRAFLTILLAWFISCCVGAPIILGLNTTPERQSTLCILYNSTFIFWSSLTSFYVPCIIMIGLYWRIFVAIRSRTKKAVCAGASAGLAVAAGAKLDMGTPAPIESLKAAEPQSRAVKIELADGDAGDKPSEPTEVGRSITARPAHAREDTRQFQVSEGQTIERLRALLARDQSWTSSPEAAEGDTRGDASALRFALELSRVNERGCSCAPADSPDPMGREMELGASVASGAAQASWPIICCQLRFISKLIRLESPNLDRLAIGREPAHGDRADRELVLCLAVLASKLTKRLATGTSLARLAWLPDGEPKFWFSRRPCQPDSPTFRAAEVGRLANDKIDAPAARFAMTARDRQARDERLLLRLVCSSGRAAAGSERVGSTSNNGGSRCPADKGNQVAARCACCARAGPTSSAATGLDDAPAIVGLVEPLDGQVLRLTALGRTSEPNYVESESLIVHSASGSHIRPQLIMLWLRLGDLASDQVAGRQMATTEQLCRDCVDGCLLGAFSRHDLELEHSQLGRQDNRLRSRPPKAQSNRARAKRKPNAETAAGGNGPECIHLSRLSREELHSTVARLANASLKVVSQTLPTSSDNQERQNHTSPTPTDEMSLKVDQLMSDHGSSYSSEKSRDQARSRSSSSSSASSSSSSSSNDSTLWQSSSARTSELSTAGARRTPRACCYKDARLPISSSGAQSVTPPGDSDVRSATSWCRRSRDATESSCVRVEPKPCPESSADGDRAEHHQNECKADGLANHVGSMGRATGSSKGRSMRLSRLIRRRTQADQVEVKRASSLATSTLQTSGYSPHLNESGRDLYAQEEPPTHNQLRSNLLLSGVAVIAHKPLADLCKSQSGANTDLMQTGHLCRPVRTGSRRRREKNAARRERKATKTLAIVLGIFLVCWTPFFTCNIIDGICIQLRIDCRPGMMVYLVTTWLGYINSCVNPLIYTIFNMEFRRAFKKILSTSFACCRSNK